MFVLDNDERIAELQQAWDELVAIAEAFACDEGELDQELFRDVLLKTWKLFSERIDFDAKYSEYCLPIGMAYVFGQMMEYSDKKQVTEREDDVNEPAVGENTGLATFSTTGSSSFGSVSKDGLKQASSTLAAGAGAGVGVGTTSGAGVLSLVKLLINSF